MARKRQIVDCATGEVTIVDYTAEEEAQADADAAAEATRREEEEAAEAARLAAKASGDAKLKELGLTDEEIAAR
ncbi:MAG: hypothetical protein CMM29_00090 [Rhodospirillaceae bacterium]|nr:hypothetical protein [Rhodospirillaceae bacterium]|tara:strand:+ start:604 stop:825 length:222 start_codon:yes stop_codon:yes gene_type:complete